MRRGAYGLHLEGLTGFDDLLVEADAGWLSTTIAVERGPLEGYAEEVDDRRATIVFPDAVARVEREPAQALFRFSSEPTLDALVHPYLAPVAGLFAHWRGYEAFHAGAFVLDGGAWGLVADRGVGKSSTLARLALDGIPIVADDLLVIDEIVALAGPRAIDLRDEPARRLGVGQPLGIVGTRSRWRFRVRAVPPSVPLRGWVFLEWGEALSVESVSARERLERLGAQRMIRRRPSDPRAFLQLAGLPGVVVRRPRAWSMLSETTSLLLESLPSPGGG